MLHANTSKPNVYWRILNTNWWAHLKLCHKNPDTLKGPGNAKPVQASSSTVGKCAPLQAEDKNSGELPSATETFFSLQMNYYTFHLLLVNSVLSTLNMRFWPSHLNSKNHRFFQVFVILFVSFLFTRKLVNELRTDQDILFNIIRNSLKSMFVKKRVYYIFSTFYKLIFSFGEINLKKKGYR